MSARGWDHPPPKTIEPQSQQTLSHSHPLWINTWPLPSAQTHSKANKADAWTPWGEGGQSQSPQLCSRRPDGPELQGTQGKPKKPLYSTQIVSIICQEESPDPKIKNAHSSLFKMKQNADGRFILSSPCSPTVPYPISHEKPFTPHKIEPRRGQAHWFMNYICIHFMGF